MSSNTQSALYALVVTLMVFLAGTRLMSGPFSWAGIIVSFLLLLPVTTIVFAISYLLINKILPHRSRPAKPKQVPRAARPDTDPGMTSFRLSKEYIFIGIYILGISVSGIIWISDELSIICLILVAMFLGTHPYRIDLLKDDSLVIHRVFNKKRIKIEEIVRITRGHVSDKIEFENGYFYFSHLISNISRLTDAIAAKMQRVPAGQGADGVTWSPPRKSAHIIRMVYIVLIASLLSVFFVFYVKNVFIKDLQIW